jgi:hypothetical protein
LHLSYNYIAKFISFATPATQNIMQPEYTAPYGQLDLSASYTIPGLKGTPIDGAQVTLDVLNITQSTMRSYVGDTNNPNSVYHPGMSVILGLRGKI